MDPRWLCALLALNVASAPALERGPDDVLVRVLDVGAALCVVVAAPGSPEGETEYMVYDTGHGRSARRGIRDMIPRGETIDLLYLSHTHGDHVGGVPWLCENYRVAAVRRPQVRRGRPDEPWSAAVRAIRQEVSEEHCVDLPIGEALTPGTERSLGRATITEIFGRSQPRLSWRLEPGSVPYWNAGSIVIRLEYQGRSVLFTGDLVGRRTGAPASACIAGEREIVENASEVPIVSDVFIAPHHGADSGSSLRFVREVSPEFVIFSSGHNHHAPRASTAARCHQAGVRWNRMLRTDRGDNEGGGEWRSGGPGDRLGDDDIDILLRADGDIAVDYAGE